MKIHYLRGDLFKTDIQFIAHGCNAQGVMGSGVAAIVRRDYSEAYHRYLEAGKQGLLRLGFVQVVPSNGKRIVNAVTQNLYGNTGKRFVSYDAVADCMSAINNFEEIYGIKEIAIPKIGAGLGGGDWNVIEQIIYSEVKNLDVYVYEL